MVLFLLPLACVASSYHTNKSPSKLNWELRINSDKETFHRERDKDREWECVFKHAYSLSVYPDSKENQSHLSGQMIFYSERPRNETTFWTCRFNKTKSHNHIYLLKSVSLKAMLKNVLVTLEQSGVNCLAEGHLSGNRQLLYFQLPTCVSCWCGDPNLLQLQFFNLQANIDPHHCFFVSNRVINDISLLSYHVIGVP